MKILKVYDKINRNTFHYDVNTGELKITEYYNDTDYSGLIINTKLFKLKNDRMSFFSYYNVVNHINVETLDITSKYLFFCKYNENGLLTHSERVHLKDNKAILLIDRIYDSDDEFIEVENHRGNRMMKFKLKDEIINKFINQK